MDRGPIVIFQICQTPLYGLAFLTMLPDQGPILISLGPRSSADGIEHPLGRVLMRLAAGSTVALEIVNECPTPLSKIAKVDCLAAFGKEQDSIKLLKEHR